MFYLVAGMLQVPLKDNNDTCTDSNTDPEARPTDIFFLSVIPVPPTKFRPVSKCRVCLFICVLVV